VKAPCLFLARMSNRLPVHSAAVLHAFVSGTGRHTTTDVHVTDRPAFFPPWWMRHKICPTAYSSVPTGVLRGTCIRTPPSGRLQRRARSYDTGHCLNSKRGHISAFLVAARPGHVVPKWPACKGKFRFAAHGRRGTNFSMFESFRPRSSAEMAHMKQAVAVLPAAGRGSAAPTALMDGTARHGTLDCIYAKNLLTCTVLQLLSVATNNAFDQGCMQRAFVLASDRRATCLLGFAVRNSAAV
jgi:hypothetical protein